VLNSIVSSVVPYRYKNNTLLKLMSPLLFVPLTPVILLQVIRSWGLSSQKIAMGPLVEPIGSDCGFEAEGIRANASFGHRP
jgi:hypothetical protein